jgi:DNA polymerase III epsilon subunit family exonuclease
MNITTHHDTSKIFDFFPEGLVCLDLETTGLSPLLNRIVEIAGIKITPSGVEKFSTLINPAILMDPRNIAIHHISNEMVKDAPSLKEMLPKFMEFTQGLPLVAHNAQFDLGFIVYGLHSLGLPFTHNEVYCTVKLSRLVFKEFAHYRLGYLAEKLNIELKNAHRAEDDAQVCLEVLRLSLLKATKKEIAESMIFHLDDFQKIEDFELKDHLKLIQVKIDSQEIMRIRYLGGSKKNEFRPIRPLSLLPLPQGNVLYAHCLESNLYKIYNLNKISECALATEEDLKKYKKEEDL